MKKKKSRGRVGGEELSNMSLGEDSKTVIMELSLFREVMFLGCEVNMCKKFG